MLNEEDLMREAERLGRLKDLLSALRKRGFDNVVCADGAHMWLVDNDKFHVEEEGEEYAYVVRIIDYECQTCGMNRHRVEIYNLDNIENHDSDPFELLQRAQHRGEEE